MYKSNFLELFNLQLEDYILKKLLLFTIALVYMLFTPVQAANVNTVKAAIVKHSIEMGVDPAITLSIAKTESGFRHEARSSHGAVGVFQLLPSTARRMGLNPYSLDDNIKGGIMYYKSMYKMFGSMQLALAAYNAGPANVKKYKTIPPFRETKRFVSNIMKDYYRMKSHTDPAIVAYLKSNPSAAEKIGAYVVASTPSKFTPLPMTRIEQSRKLNVEVIKGSPVEVELKSQSVAM